MNASIGQTLAPITYTVPRACEVSGLGRTTLYDLMGKGQIKAMKAGARTLICADSLRAYLAKLPAVQIRNAA